MIRRSEKHPRRGATQEICKQVVNTIRIEPMGLRSQIWANQDTSELRATDRQGSRESAVGVQVRGGTWTECLYARVVRRLRPRGAEVSGAAKSVDQIPMVNPETGPRSQAITSPHSPVSSAMPIAI